LCVCARACVRQPPIQMPERLCDGPVGLGIDVVRLDNGCFQVRKLQSGGAAQISGIFDVEEGGWRGGLRDWMGEGRGV